ncbi:MAG: hypothetical protein FH751_12570 [Firmicutes bacterium]|nr:hypothetical protein [Bacillota bacterium]
MTRKQLKIMMEGLIATAIEKICVLGSEDSMEDVNNIINLVEDLENFWADLSQEEITWHTKITEAVDKLK